MQAERIEFNGIPCIRLHEDGATAVVALHGAQVLSWIPADGRERLFLGERAKIAEGAAIRGGVPVIFPQFGERGPLQKHGFARNLPWRFLGVGKSVDDRDVAVFELRDSERTAHWPFAFVARLEVSPYDEGLMLDLRIENAGERAFDFTTALHTYLRVDDIGAISIEGLQGCDYEDSAAGGTLRREGDWQVRFDGEVDRIYNDVVVPLTLRDGANALDIAQSGFGDIVLWNPGEHLAARIGDLAPGEWKHFVCIEAGQVLAPVVLAPGECWSAAQSLGVWRKSFP